MDFPNQDIVKDLADLKNSIHIQRKKLLEKRLTKNPLITDLEYLLGAFLEMYEPHLHDVVQLSYTKGYLIDVSSGFSGKSFESQSLNGYIPVDYITRNKLTKLGIKFREFEGLMSLTFWPEVANIEKIKAKWLLIIKALPDKGVSTFPSQQAHAAAFRMKYIPKDKLLQKKRLFEKLLYSIQNTTKNELEKRKDKKLLPNKTELNIGTFVEELEFQTRGAVLLLNKKGYSIDAAGFMDDPSHQMIEGDFNLNIETIEKLKKFEVNVETNPSGYTRLKFSPKDADIKKIIKQWMQIASFLPEKKESAEPSMTKKARTFRMRYSKNA